MWNMVRVVRTKPDAELVRQTTALMGSADNISINMPSAPMPLPGGDAPALIHPCLVTRLTGNQPYYLKGGLIPHLTKNGHFWKSAPPAIHLTVLKYRLHIDPENSDYLNQMEKIDCGWTAPLPREHRYDGATGECTSHLVLIVRLRMCNIGLSRMVPLLRLPPQLCPQCLGVTLCKVSHIISSE